MSVPKRGASGAHSEADSEAHSTGPGSDGFTLESVRVRRLAEADLSVVAPMLALAAASGLATPAPAFPAIPVTASDRDDDPTEAEHDEYWIAECDGRILGFTLLHHVDRSRATIRAIWIDERHRRRGVGQRLLEGTVVHCRHAGYLKLVLELPFALEKMVPLFGRLGFAFARRRAVDGNTILEFYLDLYREPG